MAEHTSAYVILAANSWMQHPVGYRIDPVTGRAHLTDITAVLTNEVALVTVPHTLAGAFLASGALVSAVALGHLIHAHRCGITPPQTHRHAWRCAVRLGGATTLVAALALIVTGDIQGKIMTAVQPMKMAAAEALYHTAGPAPFSLLTIGTLDGHRPLWSLDVPGLLSFLATGHLDSTVQGIDDLQTRYAATYGPGSYTPIIPVTYWSFRLMIGIGLLGALTGLAGLWATRRGRTPTSRWLLRAAVATPLLPLAGNILGWIFTETGRQPWLVFGLLRTADGVSPTTTTAEVITSLSVFTLLYGILAVITVRLMLRTVRTGLPTLHDRTPEDSDTDDKPRHAAAHPRPRRPATPRPDQHHRPRLGRQRSLDHHRRRRHLRRLPRLVRHPVLQLLPAAAGHPGGSHPARGRLRIPRQTRRRGLAAPLGRRACTIAALFSALYPAVLPATTTAAATLTIANASASPYTLTVMTWVAGLFTPLVLLYQGWTYWVFRKRLGVHDIPECGVARATRPGHTTRAGLTAFSFS